MARLAALVVSCAAFRAPAPRPWPVSMLSSSAEATAEQATPRGRALAEELKNVNLCGAGRTAVKPSAAEKTRRKTVFGEIDRRNSCVQQSPSNSADAGTSSA